MKKESQFYRCEICGNIVEVLHVGEGELVCCGKPMQLLVANTTDGAVEKHVPVVEKTDNGFKVKVGAAPHPMEEAHFIEWVLATFDDGKVIHKMLHPGETPEVEFIADKMPDRVFAYCNLHGLWSN